MDTFEPPMSAQCKVSLAHRASSSLQYSIKALSGPVTPARTLARAPYGRKMSYSMLSVYPGGRSFTSRGWAAGGGKGVGGIVVGKGERLSVTEGVTSGIGLAWRVASAFSAVIDEEEEEGERDTANAKWM
jgi:hypothetical protein